MEIKNFLSSQFSSPCIIEAGIADGTDTLELSELFPSGFIYGFEPIPELFYKSKEKLKNKKNVSIFNLAISDKTGISNMYVSNYLGEKSHSSSLLKPMEHLNFHHLVKFDEVIEVKTINLDEFIDKNKIKTIDLLWLDLQGYEPFILKSSSQTISITKFIFCEVMMINLYDNCILYDEFNNLMNSLGFYKIWDELSENTTKVDAINCLYKNKNII
jgi:FkbM family methyltransferase